MAVQLNPQSYELFLLLDNYALGQYGTTVGPGTPQQFIEDPSGNMPLTAMLDPSLDTAYRSGSISASPNTRILIRFAFDRPRTVDSAVIGKHNVRLPWKIHLYDQDPAAALPVYNPPFQEPIVQGNLEDYEWLTMPWNLGPDAEDLALWEEQYLLTSLHVTDRPYTGIRWVDLIFNIEGVERLKQPIDYIQMASFMVGLSFRPRINMSLGWDIAVDDLSDVYRVESGAPRGRNRARLRSFNFALDYLEDDQAFRSIMTQYARRHGRLGIVFAWPEPCKPQHFYDQAMLCTADALPKTAMANLDFPASTGWKLTEAP